MRVVQRTQCAHFPSTARSKSCSTEMSVLWYLELIDKFKGRKMSNLFAFHLEKFSPRRSDGGYQHIYIFFFLMMWTFPWVWQIFSPSTWTGEKLEHVWTLDFFSSVILGFLGLSESKPQQNWYQIVGNFPQKKLVQFVLCPQQYFRRKNQDLVSRNTQFVAPYCCGARIPLAWKGAHPWNQRRENIL